MSNLKRKLLGSLVLAACVFAAYLFYTDLPALRDAFLGFQWWMLLPMLALTALNLAARYLKWGYYLNLLGVRGLSRQDSIAIFLSNFALILTPGKMGGLMKSYFVKQRTGVPMARTMPVVLAERLTDGLGMILMTLLALVAYPAAWPVVALVLLAMAAVLAVAQVRPLAFRLLALAARVPLLNRVAPALHDFYESSYELLRPRPLLWATFLGTLSRATEGVVLYLVLLGLGIPATLSRFTDAIFIAALSNVVGVVVMLPGGLGGTEGSMTGLLDYFLGLAPAPATAATLLTRFATFWLCVFLGVAALLLNRAAFFPAGGSGETERGGVEPLVGLSMEGTESSR